jgi:hypothetical protein
MLQNIEGKTVEKLEVTSDGKYRFTFTDGSHVTIASSPSGTENTSPYLVYVDQDGITLTHEA